MRLDDGFGTLRPFEGLRKVFVVNTDVAMDLVPKLFNACEVAAVQSTPLELREPRFHGIEPRCTRRCEVEVESRVFLQPVLDLLCAMGAGVVENQVQVEIGVCHLVDLTQESDEFLSTMPLRDSADDLTRGDIESRIEAAGSVAFVVVGSSFDLPWTQLKQGLSAIQRLNLCLLVNGEDDCVFRRIEVETHHILDLLCEVRILADLEVLDSMGFEVGRLPHALDLALAHAGVFGHQPKAPVRGFARNLLNGHLQNLLRLARGKNSRTAGSWKILDSFDPLLLIASAPPVDGGTGDSDLFGDLFSGLTIAEQEDDLCSFYELSGGIACSNQSLEMASVRGRNVDLFAGPCHGRIVSIDSMFWNGIFGA